MDIKAFGKDVRQNRASRKGVRKSLPECEPGGSEQGTERRTASAVRRVRWREIEADCFRRLSVLRDGSFDARRDLKQTDEEMLMKLANQALAFGA
jgi:hypothetical protein